MLRAAALLSPALGSSASATTDLLRAGGWGEPWTATKPRSTNQLLALRALANLFSTPEGRKVMAAAAENGLLVELVKGRRWAEIGTAKQPLATIALKYVVKTPPRLTPATPSSPLTVACLPLREARYWD